MKTKLVSITLFLLAGSALFCCGTTVAPGKMGLNGIPEPPA